MLHKVMILKKEDWFASTSGLREKVKVSKALVDQVNVQGNRAMGNCIKWVRLSNVRAHDMEDDGLHIDLTTLELVR